MKFCEKCGKELHDDAVICTGCGCAVPKKDASTAKKGVSPLCIVGLGLGLFGIFVGIIIPLAGFILGVVALVLGFVGVAKSDPIQSGAKVKPQLYGVIAGTLAIALSLVSWIVYFGIIMT